MKPPRFENQSDCEDYIKILENRLDSVKRVLNNDSFATSFQTLGQYRRVLREFITDVEDGL